MYECVNPQGGGPASSLCATPLTVVTLAISRWVSGSSLWEQHWAAPPSLSVTLDIDWRDLQPEDARLMAAGLDPYLVVSVSVGCHMLCLQRCKDKGFVGVYCSVKCDW